MNFLNDEERVRLKTYHKRERDGRTRDRIKAVLLHDKGWSIQQIAEALLLSDEAVRNHIDEYKASKKLSPQSGGSLEKLSAYQSQQLKNHLQEHTYLFVKDIVAYVQVIFSVTYTVRRNEKLVTKAWLFL
jgi:transposase